jgi:hypothetical protein
MALTKIAHRPTLKLQHMRETLRMIEEGGNSMKIEKLGDDLFKARASWKSWSPTKELIETILKLQGEGKVVTLIHTTSGLLGTYLIATTSKQGGL